MFCQNCGTRNGDESIFCENCGIKLERDDVMAESSMQQNMPVAAVQTSAVGNIATVTPNKVMKKWTKIIIAEVIILFIAGYGLYTVGTNSFTPQNMASTFFVNMVNGDFEAAYDQIDVEETEFINKDQFVKANEEFCLGIVSNYRVRNELSKVGNDWYRDEQAGLGESVLVDYRLKGGSSDQTYPVSLIKQMEKKYLLFDDWKVSAESLIATDYLVVAPKGASVIVDGIALNDAYLQKEEMGYGEEKDCYVIPQIFLGSHSIQVSMENKETLKEDIKIQYDNDQYVVWDMVWSQAAMKEVLQKAGEDLQKLYQAAMQGQDFDSVSDLFSGEEKYEEVRYRYEDFALGLSEQEESDTVQTIRFYDLESEICSSWHENVVEIRVDGLYDLEVSYIDWWTGERKNGSYNGESYSGSAEFVFENGNWVLVSFWF